MKKLTIKVTEKRLSDELQQKGASSQGDNCSACGGGCSGCGNCGGGACNCG